MPLIEFAATPLEQPMKYTNVLEGDYYAARFGERTTYLATYGLYVCKAVSIYNPRTKQGALAHINGTAQPERLLKPIVDSIDGDISDTEVSIIQATASEDTFLWPSADMIADHLMEYGPAIVRVDRNPNNQEVRSIALNLETGMVHDFTFADSHFKESTSNPTVSIPLRGDNIWL